MYDIRLFEMDARQLIWASTKCYSAEVDQIMDGLMVLARKLVEPRVVDITFVGGGGGGYSPAPADFTVAAGGGGGGGGGGSAHNRSVDPPAEQQAARPSREDQLQRNVIRREEPTASLAWDDIEVGDKVTLFSEVTSSEPSDSIGELSSWVGVINVTIRTIYGPRKLRVPMETLASHTRSPRIKPKDRVRWLSGKCDGEVVAVEGERAWVKLDGWEPPRTIGFYDLERLKA